MPSGSDRLPDSTPIQAALGGDPGAWYASRGDIGDADVVQRERIRRAVARDLQIGRSAGRSQIEGEQRVIETRTVKHVRTGDRAAIPRDGNERGLRTTTLAIIIPDATPTPLPRSALEAIPFWFGSDCVPVRF